MARLLSTTSMDLATTDRLLPALATSCPMPFLIVRDNLIIQASASFSELFLYPSEQLLGADFRHLPILSPPQHISLQTLLSLATAGQQLPTELTVLQENGQESPCQVILHVLQPGVEQNFFCCFFKPQCQSSADWSASTSAMQTTDESTSTTRSESLFLANMSHEIRTPMTGILGLTSLLLNSDLSSQQRLYLESIDKSARGLLEIVNDVLDFSKCENKQMRVERIDFELAELLAALDLTFAHKIADKGLRYTWQITPEVPVRLCGDPARLQQVLVNLIGNSLKFTASGWIRLDISTLAQRDDGCLLRFAVSDSGIGIASEQQQHLFAPFFQTDSSTSRCYGGTGLGLAICKKLVSLFQGEIGVSSSPGCGSTFWFTAFLGGSRQTTAAFTGSAEAEPSAKLPEQTDLRNCHNKQVLLVEDNHTNQLLLSSIFTELQIPFTMTGNGEEALAALGKQRFDLVLLDIQMPRMDGMTAIARIRSGEYPGIDRQVPVVAMTAHALPGEQKTFLDAGMNDCITKPFHLPQLYQILTRYLTKPSSADGSNQSMPSQGPERRDEMEVLLPSADIFDAASLTQRLGDDAKLLRMILAAFQEDSQLLLHYLEKACASLDRDKLKFHAHTLKGAAANTGALAIQKLARELEEQSAIAVPEKLQSLIDQLQDASQAFFAALPEQYRIPSAENIATVI